jgi:hypothetical protein
MPPWSSPDKGHESVRSIARFEPWVHEISSGRASNSLVYNTMTLRAGHLKTIILVILGIFFSIILYAEEDPGKSQSIFYEGRPEKVAYSKSDFDFPDTEYTFKPAVQGTLLSHTFIIRNGSTKPLVIKRVKSCESGDCAIVVESRSSEILPGMTGAIRIEIFTDLIDGTSFANIMTVYTNHKKYPVSTIQVFGDIIRFASVTPKNITLVGAWKEEIKATVVIIPEKAYPFKITGIKARKGWNIGYDFKEIRKDGRPAFLITVRNVSRKKGGYRDIVFVETNSDVRPEIRIRVNGDITD